MTSSTLAIQTDHLRKVYGGSLKGQPFVAVQDMNLQVPRGQVFGFLGPNGAGKTTTINMLLGNIAPTAGSAQLLGRPIGDIEARAKLGFLPEKFQFHDFLTAEEFLDLHGKLYGMSAAKRRERIGETLEMVGLTARRKSKIREFSKGMQQRVGLAQAILNDPDLVILDEPTSALDPLGRREVREIVTALKAQGKTVMLNSHLLSEIEMTCDQVAILKAGQVIKQGKIDDLLAAPATVQMRILNQSPALMRALGSLARTVEAQGEMVTASISEDGIIPDLVAAVVGSGGRLMSLLPIRESLEDLFIRVVETEGTI
ncbi:multidrug ABC transporter ATP-binding protein [Capsulimonas corticalis]|uniref:Multidrug ABC transporter ATP-binding protein n=1 Tax=Capsulimonas corticalis TaxID=2219043 RepID=A0A402CUJ5_9BACT|nr:ABC transporter ATP-binding protein [Capsulimonas corticalis]BDI29023.1 multidrug ABC transporter ATP-binding protein [Capsulimonas corticalis]